jgi:hypothetical protein
MATSPSPALPRSVAYRRIFVEAGKAIVLALAINVLLYYVFVAVGWIDTSVVVSPDGSTLDSPVHVIRGTVIGMIVGTLIFLLLARFSRNAGRIFTWICVAVFVITLPMPFLFIKDVPFALALSLSIMHLPPTYLSWRFLTRAIA